MIVTNCTRVLRSTNHVPHLSIRSWRLLWPGLCSSHKYATQSSPGSSSTISRKQVTVTNDDGRVQWVELTMGEKLARTTQQTFNLGLILAGAVMTGGVGYLLYSDVFSSDSKTRIFNRTADRVKSDSRAIELLGPSKQILALGQERLGGSRTFGKRQAIQSTTRTDRDGTEHFLMHFNIEGPLSSGVVNLHMIRPSGAADYTYKYLTLDVKGHSTLYLENSDKPLDVKKSGFKLFGVKWH